MPAASYHQSQLPNTPCCRTSEAVARGASIANQVAAIDVPASHQGSERPATKYSSTLRPARRANQKPSDSVTSPYAETTIQSTPVSCMTAAYWEGGA